MSYYSARLPYRLPHGHRRTPGGRPRRREARILIGFPTINERPVLLVLQDLRALNSKHELKPCYRMPSYVLARFMSRTSCSPTRRP